MSSSSNLPSPILPVALPIIFEQVFPTNIGNSTHFCSPRDFLLAFPSHAYTVLRTTLPTNTFSTANSANTSPHQLSTHSVLFHSARLLKTSQTMYSFSSDSQFQFEFKSRLRSFLLHLVTQLNEWVRVGRIEECEKWKTKECLITLLVLNHTNYTTNSTTTNYSYSFVAHYSLAASPYDFSPALVVLLGLSRTSPEGKYSEWVRQRQILEKVKTQEKTDEVILSHPTSNNNNNDSNCTDSIMDLCLSEGTVTNLFIITHSNIILTAPDTDALNGYYRHLIVDVATNDSELGMKLDKHAVKWSEHKEWKEMFLTSTGRIVTPIKKIRWWQKKGSNEVVTDPLVVLENSSSLEVCSYEFPSTTQSGLILLKVLDRVHHDCSEDFLQ